MILIKDDHDDSRGFTWRSRRTRRPSWIADSDKRGAGDLPVFLVNSELPVFSGKDVDYPDYTNAARRKRLTLTPRRLQAELHARYLFSKERITALRQQVRVSSAKLTNAKFQSELARFGLIMLVLPLVLLFMSERSFHPDKRMAISPPQSLPKFDLDGRLAFAENLRDQFVSRGITSSLENTPSQSAANSQPATTMEQTTSESPQSDANANSDTPALSLLAIAPTATDDRQWRLPFDSNTYIPRALPTTAAGSFRAEIAMSELMSEKTSIAANEISDDTPAPVMKRAVQKRKKAIAQKRRPQSAGQMTASAAPAPVVANQQPNLPPPPILFFLGAPPPPSQSAP